MALVLVTRRPRSFAAQELPEHDPMPSIERIVSIMRDTHDVTWQIVRVPDHINGRDVTRYAEEVTA